MKKVLLAMSMIFVCSGMWASEKKPETLDQYQTRRRRNASHMSPRAQDWISRMCNDIQDEYDFWKWGVHQSRKLSKSQGVQRYMKSQKHLAGTFGISGKRQRGF